MFFDFILKIIKIIVIDDKNDVKYLKNKNNQTFYFTDLLHGLQYYVRVVAANEAGESIPSGISEPFFALDVVPPPTDLKVAEVTNSSMLLEWKPPVIEDNNIKVASYVVEKRHATLDGRWEQCNFEVVSRCEYEIDQLMKSAPYEFRVFSLSTTGTLGQPSQVCGPVLCEIVLLKPTATFAMKDKIIEIEAGEDLVIQADVAGTPRPEIVWVKEGQEDIINDMRVTIKSSRTKSIFSLKKVTRNDAGNYKVSLSNKEGSFTASVVVKVLTTPGKPEGPVEISQVTAKSCLLKWKPPLQDGGFTVKYYIVSVCETSKLSWNVVNEQSETTVFRASNLEKDREYVFRINAVSDRGTGPYLTSEPVVASCSFTAPSSPGKPEPTRTHFNSITIKWNEPESDGGGKIIGYHVERLKDKGQRWARCNDEAITDTQYRITSLIEGAFYEFRVCAENAAGISLPSPVSKPIECRIQVIPPGPPCLVRLVDTSKNSATIDWEAPLNDNGSEVTGYVVEKKKFDATDSAEWFIVNETPVTDCKMVVDGLEENLVYELQVKAINAAGLGQPCECNDFIKAVDRSEEPEFILDDDFKSIQNVFSGQSLSLKAGFNGKPFPIAKWTKDENEITSSVSYTSGPNAVLNLENIKREDAGKYVVSIENHAGCKKLRFTVNVFDVPGPVGPINYKEIKSESVTLSWNEPEFDGCCELTGYLIEKCDLLQMTWSTVCSDCTRTFYRLDKLVEGKTYKFRVTAFNKYGAGVSRETEESLKITNAPSAPLNLIVEEVSLNTV